MRDRKPSAQRSRGMTLVELMVTTTILGVVLLVVTGLFLSTSRLHSRTARRAEVQMNSRQGMSLMTTELRQAGADPSEPPIGITPVVTARGDLIRIRADLNGDGVLQTSEPSEDITYSYDSTARVINRDPGSGPVAVIPNVTSMAFSYFDFQNNPLTPVPLSAANTALVRSVGVTITSEDGDSQPITLSTRITLRNQ